jgi:hypothetical protein
VHRWTGFADAFTHLTTLRIFRAMRKLVSPGSLTVPSGSKAASDVALEAITPEEAENAAERSYARV